MAAEFLLNAPARARAALHALMVVGSMIVAVEASGTSGEILFTRDGRLYVMDTDGGNPRIAFDHSFLPSGTAHDGNWSPDGTRLAFVSNNDIWVVDADGTNSLRLTNSGQGVEEVEPAWSPNGGHIAFVSYRDGNAEIYLIEPSGENLLRLTDIAGYDRRPTWSPDGSEIAFESTRNGNDVEIYTMKSNGTEQTNITNTPAVNEWQPSWSPDGTRIAINQGYLIYVMDANGANRTQVLSGALGGWYDPPAWSPDSTQLLVTNSSIAGNFEIYKVDVDGNNLINLTNDSAHDVSPEWLTLRCMGTDSDGDGLADECDAFPNDPSETTDTDGDGTGDNADAFPFDPSEHSDTDSDGVGNNGDNCPATPNPGQENFDGDAEGDTCDSDDDNDGTADVLDAFPFDATEDTDTDDDGIGDNADTDDDNDGLSDGLEAVLGTNSLLEDTDGDGVPDGAELAAGTDPLDITAFLPTLTPIPLGALTALLLTLGLAGLGMRRRYSRWWG